MDVHLTDVRVPAGEVRLDGTLALPVGARGVVVVVSNTPRSGETAGRLHHIAEALQRAGLATLIIHLLTPEEAAGAKGGQDLLDVDVLARRLGLVSADLSEYHAAALRVGCVGAGAGAAVAVAAAALRPAVIGAVVSLEGRLDLASRWVPRVQAPTLLVVGGHDEMLLGINRQTLGRLPATAVLEAIHGARPGLEEPGALDEAARLARHWFSRHLLHVGHEWLGPRLRERRFQDRAQAGRMLAAELTDYAGLTEVMVLAVSPGGVVVGVEVARCLGLPLTAGEPDSDLRGQTVILVDQGAVTGATMRAAIVSTRSRGPARIVVAIPVAPPETCRVLAGEVDEFVCLIAPELFFHLGWWYREFPEYGEEQVAGLLERSYHREPLPVS